MNVGIRTVAAQLLSWEYLFRIFGIVSLRCIPHFSDTFPSCVLQPFFVERVFQIFDKDDSGSISFQEFLDAMHQFAGQTPDDKIKFLFKVYDIDGKEKEEEGLECV
jgi:hypothetical protein